MEFVSLAFERLHYQSRDSPVFAISDLFVLVKSRFPSNVVAIVEGRLSKITIIKSRRVSFSPRWEDNVRRDATRHFLEKWTIVLQSRLFFIESARRGQFSRNKSYVRPILLNPRRRWRWSTCWSRWAWAQLRSAVLWSATRATTRSTRSTSGRWPSLRSRNRRSSHQYHLRRPRRPSRCCISPTHTTTRTTRRARTRNATSRSAAD